MKIHFKVALLKALTWRITASLTTIILAFIFTGTWRIAFSIGLMESLAKIALYVVHERLWQMRLGEVHE